jgi:peptidoglycan hydrolase-like protein with peptidoglycan-binding domain
MNNFLLWGSTGKAVEHLQSSLNYLKAVSPSLAVDGIFGPKTHNAVLAFQGAMKLSVDGIVGPKTAGTLNIAVLIELKKGLVSAPTATNPSKPPPKPGKPSLKLRTSPFMVRRLGKF